MADTTIAIRDDSGALRRIVKIMPMNDGVSVSVPYHSGGEGWLCSFRPKYDRIDYVDSLSEFTHYTASDRVKLSIHFSGFAHFSSGGKRKILSGYDSNAGRVKGLGLRAPDRIQVTSGPLFGVVARGVEDFEPLGDKKAMIFERDDLWHHPRINQNEAKSYHFEFFMFPTSRLREVMMIDGKRMLRTELPFASLFRFRFNLRVIELPKCRVFLGVILHRIDTGEAPSGFALAGPSCGAPGQEKVAINAWYPKPEFIKDSQSLDYA